MLIPSSFTSRSSVDPAVVSLAFAGCSPSLSTSLYAALTQVNVPDEQAREVVEALENEMTRDFATKTTIALLRADIAIVRADMVVLTGRLDRHEELAKVNFSAFRNAMSEFAAVRGEMKAGFAAVRNEMITLENRLIIKLGGLMVVLVTVWTALSSWLA